VTTRRYFFADVRERDKRGRGGETERNALQQQETRALAGLFVSLGVEVCLNFY